MGTERAILLDADGSEFLDRRALFKRDCVSTAIVASTRIRVEPDLRLLGQRRGSGELGEGLLAIERLSVPVQSVARIWTVLMTSVPSLHL